MLAELSVDDKDLSEAPSTDLPERLLLPRVFSNLSNLSRFSHSKVAPFGPVETVV